jgi:hypothetical protein
MDVIQEWGHAVDAVVAAALLKGGEMLFCASTITVCIDHFLSA